MIPAKVKVLIACFAYGGNGGTSSIIPEIAIWLCKTYYEMRNDPRIAAVAIKIYSDTPITMTRNRAVRDAKLLGYDMLLMLDSDNEPDGYLQRYPKEAKPFWETAFNFSYERLCKNIPTVIAAPYCGPPPHPVGREDIIDNGEVPYLFLWSNRESDNPNTSLKLSILTRNEAAKIKGIYPVAALPTGVCLFTLSVFEGMQQPYFEYEMSADGAEKESTEDVVATRDISLFWKMTKNLDVIFAACDSWALHHKPKRVGRPQFVAIEQISEKMLTAIRGNHSVADEVRYVDYTDTPLPPGLEVVQTPVAKDYQLSNDYKYDITPSTQPDTLPPPADIDISKLPRRGDILRHDQDYVYITDEELEEARVLAELEQQTGSDIRDIQIPTDYEKTRAAVEQSDSDGTLWRDSVPVAVDPDYTTTKSNGQQGLKYRMIGQRKVAELGATITDSDVENIQALTTWLVEKNDGNPIEVAVAHAGAGQSAAAIEFHLPEGSHLYALDSVNTHQFSSDPADNFSKSFQNELESGRVMADLYGRKFPWPEGSEHLNFVFIERSMNSDKLQSWSKHLLPGGILAGLGYTTGGVKRVVDEFAANRSQKVQSSGDVWAVQV